ncbi:Filamentous hemagglutinin, partial [Frankliniella fusca]
MRFQCSSATWGRLEGVLEIADRLKYIHLYLIQYQKCHINHAILTEVLRCMLGSVAGGCVTGCGHVRMICKITSHWCSKGLPTATPRHNMPDSAIHAPSCRARHGDGRLQACRRAGAAAAAPGRYQTQWPGRQRQCAGSAGSAGSATPMGGGQASSTPVSSMVMPGVVAAVLAAVLLTEPRHAAGTSTTASTSTAANGTTVSSSSTTTITLSNVTNATATAATSTSTVPPRLLLDDDSDAHHDYIATSRDYILCTGLRCKEGGGGPRPTCGYWEVNKSYFLFDSLCDLLYFSCMTERNYTLVTLTLCTESDQMTTASRQTTRPLKGSTSSFGAPNPSTPSSPSFWTGAQSTTQRPIHASHPAASPTPSSPLSSPAALTFPPLPTHPDWTPVPQHTSPLLPPPPSPPPPPPAPAFSYRVTTIYLAADFSYTPVYSTPALRSIPHVHSTPHPINTTPNPTSCASLSSTASPHTNAPARPATTDYVCFVAVPARDAAIADSPPSHGPPNLYAHKPPNSTAAPASLTTLGTSCSPFPGTISIANALTYDNGSHLSHPNQLATSGVIASVLG